MTHSLHSLSARALTLLASTTLVMGVVAAVSEPAGAAVADPEPITTGLAGPLQLDVGAHGEIYVGQSFAGILTKVNRNGKVVVLRTEPVSVTGVASRGKAVAYTVRGDDPAKPLAKLKLRRPNGKVRVVADLARYEAKNNPDQLNRYGFRGLSAACLAQLPEDFQPYTGQVDSNPYALLNTKGGWYVADAGANTILKVTRKGKVSTHFVFRPQKTVVSAEQAEAFGLPACVAGKTFAFEPVPTDAEYNFQGDLLVSLLPGGPEDASLGARGAIIRVAGDGEFTNLAHGFLGATNLAVGPNGKIYVAELFGNRISMYRNGKITHVADVPSPAGLEFSNGKLIASTDVFGAGNLVRITP